MKSSLENFRGRLVMPHLEPHRDHPNRLSSLYTTLHWSYGEAGRAARRARTRSKAWAPGNPRAYARALSWAFQAPQLRRQR